ncbi:MAG: hypothetical protein H6810_10645 [Phycisphaeraceae bacterium]|nr:MAG: hypothetical protein H6810_10645 [Phycisphaeraceae bacterium]
MREIPTPHAFTIAAVLSAAFVVSAQATPENWDIRLVCRSSLDAGIPAYRLPQISSLSSQYVSLDEQGRVAIRAFLGAGGITEGVFVGDANGGGLVLTASSTDPVWTTDVDLHEGYLSVEDGTIGPGGADVYDLAGNLLQRYEVGLYGVDGSVSLADGGGIGYRAAAGFSGQAIVFDEYVAGKRVQTEVISTLDAADNVSFILSPAMNATRAFVANTIPNTGPSRRIRVFEPDAGGYTEWVAAETGGEFSSFVNSTAIANDGRVAFTARRTIDSIWQVSRRDDASSPVVSIARGGDMGIVNANLANFPPVVNSSGLVAFRVEDAAGSTALYVGDGDSLVRVLGYGDTVMTDLGEMPVGFDFGGSTGVQVMNGVVDINAADQIAFACFLQNGTIGVFVATPAAAGCNPADVAEPYGVLDLADVQAFVGAFVAGGPLADIAEPFGVLDLADVQAFIGSFLAGCP